MPKLNPVSYKHLMKVFEREGFACTRIKGDHMIFTNAGILSPVVIPMSASVPVFIIKNNLKTGGISRERYFEILGH